MAATGVALAALMASCGGQSGRNTGDVPVIDLAGSVDRPAFMDIDIADVEYTPLDTATAALLGEHANVMAVMGDTAIIHEMGVMGDNSRLMLFSISDGRFIREIKHCGQGPGEYSWIETVFPDREKQQIVIKGANESASRYTLSDSFVEAYPRYEVRNSKFAAGSLAGGINITEVVDGNLLIHQLDSRMVPANTLVAEGFDPAYISMEIITSGDETLINVVDTLYTILPGRFEPVAVLARGDKSLTPAVEKEVYLGQKDYQLSQEARKKYIQYVWFLSDGPHIMLMSIYGGRYFIDFFDRGNGAHLGRSIFSYEDPEPGLAIDWNGTTFHITNRFNVTDGRFYALVRDDETVDADGNPAPDGNLGIVSFRLAPKR